MAKAKAAKTEVVAQGEVTEEVSDLTKPMQNGAKAETPAPTTELSRDDLVKDCVAHLELAAGLIKQLEKFKPTLGKARAKVLEVIGSVR